MHLPFWLLKFLPMWEYICPACRREVKKNSHNCSHCGERFPLALKVPPSFLKDPKKLETYVHKYVFPRISEFERNYLTKYFTVLFSDGFESGNLSAWTGTSIVGTGTIAVESNNPHHGTYNAKATATALHDAAEARETITSTAIVYMRFYFKFDAYPAADTDTLYLGSLYDTAGTSYIAAFIKRTAINTYYWGVQTKISPAASVNDLEASASNPSLNTWYCIEFLRDMTNGKTELWINGTLLVNANRAHATNSADCYAGIDGWESTGTVHMYVDCVVVADTYIGPEVPFYPYVEDVSDVDSSVDIGTHSDFTKQQATADADYDTLTEANAGTPSTITRGATVSTWVTSSTTTGPSGTNFPHTVNADTTLLIVTIGMDADESISAVPVWNTNETLTLIHATTASGSSSDERVYTYGLVNPTVKSDYITFTMSSDDHAYAVAVNYKGTVTSSVADATNFLNEKVNDSAATTTALASGGDSGSTLFLSCVFEGGDGDPSTNNAGFAELADSATGTSTTGADDAYYVADKIGGAPTAVTVDWYNTTSDENAGHLIEILPAPNTNYRLELEEQFTEVPEESLNLHVQTGAFSGEILNVEAWDGDSWEALGATSASTDNDMGAIADYVSSGNLYIRFVDGTQSSDTVQSTWQIDSVWLETGAETYTKSFTFTGHIQKTLSKTLTFNGHILETLTKPFTFNGSLMLVGGKPFTFDGHIKKPLTKPFSFDGLLKKALTKPFSFDGHLLKSGVTDFSFDGNLYRIGSAYVAFDGHLLKAGVEAFTFDGTLLKQLTKDFSLDGHLLKSLEAPFTFDGALLKTSAKPFTFDGHLLKELGIPLTFDGHLLKELGKSFTFDGALLKALSKPFSFDGHLQKTLGAPLTFNGHLLKAGTATLTFDGSLLKTLAKTFTYDGTLQKTFLKNFTFDGILELVAVVEEAAQKYGVPPSKIIKQLGLPPELLELIKAYLELKLNSQ